MSPERARQVANGILTVAGVALAVVVWRQPALRRMARQLVPVALREIRPVHVAAVMAALAGPPAVTAAAVAAAKAADTSESDRNSDTVTRAAAPSDSRA
jgi:hypothetical protein